MANSPARAALDVGSVIADTYVIEALVGRGGMGSVFLASHKRLPGKQVAIKLLHAEMIEDDVLARFRREAEIASRLGHPNIVTVHDFNVTPDGTPYLVLEYLQGESLAQRLRAGPLPIDQILSIVRQIGSALAAAHRGGIVHRDLKPQNIFLVPTEVDGQHVEIAKVLDFGISKIRGSETVKTQESTLLGTPQYMAPEQARGEHASCDERTDVFAFGAIVYEMLCGHPAFQGASIPEVVFKVVYEQPMAITEAAPGVSPAVALAVNQAMAKVAAERFSNVSSFVEAMTGQPVSQLRVPAVLPVEPAQDSGARARGTGKEAFAQTMGSGDHGSAATASAAPPNAAAVSQRPSMGTPSTQVRQPAMASPDALTVGSVSAIPIPRRSRGVVAGVALAGVIAAVVVIYLVTRGGPAARPQIAGAAEVVRAPADAMQRAVTTDAARGVGELDAASAVMVGQDAASVAANPKQPRPNQPRPNQPIKPVGPIQDPEPTSPGSGDRAAQDLQQAEADLASGKLETAERFANAVINSQASGRALARAHSIHGVVMCMLHNDGERAKADLRSIPRRFSVIRQALLTACHDLISAVDR